MKKYDYTRLPDELKRLGKNYGLFQAKKGRKFFPLDAKLYLVGGWMPMRIDEPDTLSTFDEAVRAYQMDTKGEIGGIACVLREEHELFVVDIDKPVPREKFKANGIDYDEYVRLHGLDSADMIEEFKRGTFIERSRSGEGAHMIFNGKGFNGKFVLGDLFAWNQAIYLTADLIPGARDKLAGQAGIDYFLSKVKTKITVTAKEGENAGIGREFYTAHGRNADLTNEQVLQAYFKRNKEHIKVYEGKLDIVGKTSIQDWSNGTDIMQSELDKITANPDQIYDIMFDSPRLIHAGYNHAGVDRRKRTDNFFYARLGGARKKNDKHMAVHGNPYAMRQEAVDHGKANAAMFGGQSAAAPDAPMHDGRSLSERLGAAGAYPKIGYEGEEVWFIGDERLGSDEKVLLEWLAKMEAAALPPPVATPREIKPQKLGRFTSTTVKALQELMGSLPGEYLKFNEPPGLLGEACRYCAMGMYEPLPFLAVPATICAMGGIMAQRWKYHHHGLNVMIIAGAKTGVGKTQAADVWNKYVDEILQTAGPNDGTLYRCQNRMSPFNIGSKVGAHTLLQKRSCFAWFQDECEHLLDMINGRSDPLAITVQQLVLKMFEISEDAIRWEPDESRTGQNNKDRVLRNVSISAFWATTIETLGNYMHPEFLSKGFGSRFLYLLYKGISGLEQDPKFIMREIPDGDLRGRLKTLLRLSQELEDAYKSFPEDYEALSAEEKKATQIPEQKSHREMLVHVGETGEAGAFMAEMRATAGRFKRKVQLDQSEFPEHYNMFSRVALIAQRIAGIMAVMENPHNPEISLQQIHWAYGYAFQITGETISAFDMEELGTSLNKGDRVAIELMRKLIMHEPRIATVGIRQGDFMKRLKALNPFKSARGSGASQEADRAVARVIEYGLFDREEYVAAPGSRGRPGARLKITGDDEWADL